jgi:uncharacterized membrane protein YkoI
MVQQEETRMMRRKIATGLAAGAAALGAVGGVAVAADSGGATPAPTSRLDDGKQLLSQSKITEAQAIAAAQGDLNEVDLEQYEGALVWNVDVGTSDVKVDATSGTVVHVAQDD